MLERIDAVTLQSQGFEYSEDEYNSALFAATVQQQWFESPQTRVPAADAIVELATQTIAELQFSGRRLHPNLHSSLTRFFLPELVRIHDGLRLVRPTTVQVYAVGCATLGVSVADMFSNAVTARSILEGNHEVVLVD